MAQTINDVQNKPNWIAFKYDKTLLLIYDFLKAHRSGKSLEVSKCPIVNFEIFQVFILVRKNEENQCCRNADDSLTSAEQW